MTIREIASDVGVAFGTVQSIFTEDRGMSRVSAKFIPKLLSDKPRDSRVQVCRPAGGLQRGSKFYSEHHYG